MFFRKNCFPDIRPRETAKVRLLRKKLTSPDIQPREGTELNHPGGFLRKTKTAPAKAAEAVEVSVVLCYYLFCMWVGEGERVKQHIQQFGSDWTQEKLDIFTSYLEAYLQALKNRKFGKIYIDAFAGTGEIVTQDEEVLIGSAKRALSAKNLFDRYYFIEADRKKYAELTNMIAREFSHLSDRITVRNGDANKELASIISDIDWRYNRGLLFLDPCATEVNWSTLESIADTKAIDVWYLFPFSALNRLLKKDGNLDPSWAACIDRLLGDSRWREEFYKQDDQFSLFDSPDEGAPERLVKTANAEKIKEYILGRLKTVFAEVSKNPRVFKNEKNSPLFLFCFAVSNPSIKARALALKISDQILCSKKM